MLLILEKRPICKLDTSLFYDNKIEIRKLLKVLKKLSKLEKQT